MTHPVTDIQGTTIICPLGLVASCLIYVDAQLVAHSDDSLFNNDVIRYWTSSQSKPNPLQDFEAVQLDHGSVEWTALQRCMAGNDVGKGGRDAVGSKPYTQLEVTAVWRIENQTLWAKYAAEKMQTSVTMKSLPTSVKIKTANPRLNKTLVNASRAIRKKGGCDPALNEYYLFHGLGSPDHTILNIASAGHNEHFSGANAGTMFGDGVYLAEDMGKSDQYCRPLQRATVNAITSAVPKISKKNPMMPTTSVATEHQALKNALFANSIPKEKDQDNVDVDVSDISEWRFTFVSRTVIGAFVQQGAAGPGSPLAQQLNSALRTFSAGTRELALIPEQMPYVDQ